jgi:antitoxin CptB
MTENQPIRLKRLHYRSWHRGCKETDVILGNFADRHLEELSPAQLDIYERLLDEQDADIWNWLVGKTRPPQREYAALIAILRKFSSRRFRASEEA